MKSIILFWAGKGVRIFRVDNPHTKPVAFWGWMIEGVQAQYPDTIFLSEAFTKPKMMKALAKAGFTQSYSYFTWRNTKPELTEYFTELTQTEMKNYYRANLFPNTPDILPFFLQHGGRPAFMIRATLAATLSSGSTASTAALNSAKTRLCPGREEYYDSEKYQFKGRDWNAPGNIKDHLTKLNTIRKQNRALHLYDNLRFLPSDNDQILFYMKATEARDNIVLIAVNLDPYNAQSGYVELPFEEFGYTGPRRCLHRARPADRRAVRVARPPQLRCPGPAAPPRARVPRRAIVATAGRRCRMLFPADRPDRLGVCLHHSRVDIRMNPRPLLRILQQLPPGLLIGFSVALGPARGAGPALVPQHRTAGGGGELDRAHPSCRGKPRGDLLGRCRTWTTPRARFVLTGSEATLHAYTTALQNLPRKLDEMQKMVSDNPAQVRRLDKLRTDIDQRLAQAQMRVQQRRELGADALGLEVSQPYGFCNSW